MLYSLIVVNMCLLMCCSCCTLSIRVSVKSELLPFLPCLLSCGLHGTLQRALKRLQLARCLLQQKPSHKLLQVCGLLVILHVRGKEFIVYNSSLHLHQGSVNWMARGQGVAKFIRWLISYVTFILSVVGNVWFPEFKGFAYQVWIHFSW